jgi:hypothetical protein
MGAYSTVPNRAARRMGARVSPVNMGLSVRDSLHDRAACEELGVRYNDTTGRDADPRASDSVEDSLSR